MKTQNLLLDTIKANFFHRRNKVHNKVIMNMNFSKLQIPRLNQLMDKLWTYISELEKKPKKEDSSPKKTLRDMTSSTRFMEMIKKETPKLRLLLKRKSIDYQENCLVDANFESRTQFQKSHNQYDSSQGNTTQFQDQQNEMRQSNQYVVKNQQEINKLRKMLKDGFQRFEKPSEIFDFLNQYIQQVLECDRVQVWLYDPGSNLIWTKGLNNEKVYQQLRGLTLYTIKQQVLINIPDVYQDIRFDQEYDQKYKQKTKSLMCCPLDEKGLIIVSNTTKLFRKEDEQLLQLLGIQAKFYLEDIYQQEYLSDINNNVTKLINCSIVLIQAKDQKQLILFSQNILNTKFHIKQSQIYLKDQQDLDYLFSYSNEGKRKKISKSCGIVGQVYLSKESRMSESCYKDKFYNNLADIDTNLPIITMPIINDKCQGVIQFIDNKGVDNILSRNFKCQKLSTYEQIYCFASMLELINSKFIVGNHSHNF
ncbi:hypothetical protein pb186bvf_001932 [Paramecium bursaria]